MGIDVLHPVQKRSTGSSGTCTGTVPCTTVLVSIFFSATLGTTTWGFGNPCRTCI